jgi:peptidoglycan hydrolase-like protein with peptidoglycan-binding domain
MDAATSRAIQTFQMQQQLPPTGTLDESTIAALQTACGGSEGSDGGDGGGGE